MENGEPFCNHCEKHYVPVSLGRTACSNCGCGKPQDDHGLEHVEGPTAKDLAPRDIVKQDKLASVDDYLATFHASEGNGSKLFYEGYSDAAAGKPMDEDQALLSKDYYNGYEQYKFYNKTPQQSVGQELIDMKPNSNQIPRAGDTNNGELNKGGLDTGPFELTASRNPFPVDVIQNFFEV